MTRSARRSRLALGLVAAIALGAGCAYAVTRPGDPRYGASVNVASDPIVEVRFQPQPEGSGPVFSADSSPGNGYEPLSVLFATPPTTLPGPPASVCDGLMIEVRLRSARTLTYYADCDKRPAIRRLVTAAFAGR